MSLRSAMIMAINSDGTKFEEEKGFLVGYSNGQTILIQETPNSNEFYTASFDFLLANGVVATTRPASFIATVQKEVPAGSGNFETWYQYGYVIGQDITSVASQNTAIPLLVTAINKEIATNETIRSYQAEFSVQASVEGVTPEPPEDIVDTIFEEIDKKRAKNPDPLPDIDFNENNIFTLWDATNSVEVKVTELDYVQRIKDELGDVTSRIAYATNGLALDSLGVPIVNPFGGPTPVSRSVDDTNDTDYDKATPVPVQLTIAQTNVWQIASVNVYPIGFLNLTNQDIVFTQSIYGRRIGGNIELRSTYYVYSEDQGVIPDVNTPFTVGGILTFDNDVIDPKQQQTLAIGVNIDPSVGERVMVKTEIRGTAGDQIYAELEGGVATFNTWQVPTGDAISGLIRKIPNAVVDNIVSQNLDGSLKDGGIAIDNLVLLDAIQSFLETITFLSGINVTGASQVDGDLVVNGNFTVNTPGTQTILNTITLEVKDNITLLAKGQASGVLDAGFEVDRGSDANQFILWQESSDLWKITVNGTLQRLATIVDNPTVDRLFTYDAATGNLIERTAAQVKALLAIAISDVNGLQAVLDNLDNIKIEGIDYENNAVLVRNGKKLSIISGGNFIPDPGDPNRVLFEILGVGGTGTGKPAIGFAEIAAPLAVTPVLTEIPITFTEIQESDNPSVFTIDDSNNRFLLETTGISDENVFYKFGLKVTVSNSGNSNSDLDFIAKLDGVEVDRQTVTIKASGASTDGIDNFTVDLEIETDKTQTQQILTLFVESPVDLGKTIERMEIVPISLFVVGENIDNFLTFNIYDPEKSGKVILSRASDSLTYYETTNPQLADLVSTDTDEPNAGKLYVIQLQNTLDGSNMSWTKKTAGIKYDIYEQDGVTNAVGTDYIDIPTNKITVLFDGTKLIIQSNEKNIQDILDGTTPVPKAIADQNGDVIDITYAKEIDLINKAEKSLVNDNSTDIAEIKFANFVSEQFAGISSRSSFGTDETNEYNLIPQTFNELLKSNYSAGTTVINDLTDTTGLIAGQELFISDNLNAGNNEFVTIVSVDSPTQITTSAFVNSYTTANSARIGRTIRDGDDVKTWSTEYDGTGQPEDVVGITLGAGSDGSSVSTNGVLQVITTGTQRYFWDFDGTVDNTKITRFETNVQVIADSGLSGSDGGHNIFIGNGTKIHRIVLMTDRLRYEKSGGFTDYLIDLSSSFNNIRIEFNKTTDASIWINDVLIDTILYANLTSVAINNIQVGDSNNISTNRNGNVKYDFFNVQYDLEANPDQTISSIIEVLTEEITSNQGNDIDFIVVEEEYSESDVFTITKEVSISADDNESYVALTEDTDKAYTNGSGNKVKQFSGLVPTPASKVFLRTTITKPLTTDTYTRIKEYGKVD